MSRTKIILYSNLEDSFHFGNQQKNLIWLKWSKNFTAKWKLSKVLFNGYKKLKNFRIVEATSGCAHACCICVGKCINGMNSLIVMIQDKWTCLYMHSIKLVRSCSLQPSSCLLFVFLVLYFWSLLKVSGRHDVKEETDSVNQSLLSLPKISCVIPLCEDSLLNSPTNMYF